MRFFENLSLLFIFASWLISGEALAQSTNSYPCGDGSAVMPLQEKAVGICGLGPMHMMSDSGSNVIDFGIRSCWAEWEGNEWETVLCKFARRYTIRIDGPTTGSQFALSGPSGAIPINLVFGHPTNGSHTLLPTVESSRFDGAANTQVPVEFRVTPAGQASFPPGNYSGTFYFYLHQCDPWWEGGICMGTNANQTTYLASPVSFTIEVAVGPQIRISNLQDIALNTGSGGDIEDARTFCVHTTGSGRFNLRADSRHGNGEFTLLGMAGIDAIDYQLYVGRMGQGQGQEAELAEGVVTSRPQWRGHAQDGCNSGAENNMRIRVHIPESELFGLEDSTYTDTVTLTVEPE